VGFVETTMKILFTGGSSFTGYWFVRQLAQAGHDVTATFTRSGVGDYGRDVRGKRVADMQQYCKPAWNVAFGDERFVSLLDGVNVLCHHAADVTNYKSLDFDAGAAVSTNTKNLRIVLDALKKQGSLPGSGAVLLTNSVFAGGYGAGTLDAHGKLPHFSPYGLSKALTAEMFEYYCDASGVPMGQLVIPNPFGPFEEPRFTNYLMKTWFAGKKAGCNTPAYVRDNIHVELLARVYVQCAEKLHELPGAACIVGPHGYIESQGAFAQRFGAEMRLRLGLACDLELAHQTEFTEPRVRINTDTPDASALGFDEAKAWDAVAEYYLRMYGGV
jgi:nucleoside-diphosphate-sugar epimerase